MKKSTHEVIGIGTLTVLNSITTKVYCTECKYQLRDWDILEPISLACKFKYNTSYEAKYCKRFRPIKGG